MALRAFALVWLIRSLHVVPRSYTHYTARIRPYCRIKVFIYEPVILFVLPGCCQISGEYYLESLKITKNVRENSLKQYRRWHYITKPSRAVLNFTVGVQGDWVIFVRNFRGYPCCILTGF